MEKLKKFNHVLFSILGPLLIIVIFMALYLIGKELFGGNDYVSDRLIAKEELESLTKQNLRKQIVSLETMVEFDTAEKLYLIPVSQKTLKEPTSRTEIQFAYVENDYYPSNHAFGDWNNFILIDYKTNTYKTLLDHRVNISMYQIFKRKTGRYIVFSGWQEDTNNDGELGGKDFREVYIYNSSTDKLTHIENDKYFILYFIYYPDIDRLVFISIQEPEIQDLDINAQPKTLLEYSFEKNHLAPIVDTETMNKLQSIIDR